MKILKKKKIILKKKKFRIYLERLYDFKKISPNYVNWLKDDEINEYLEVRFRNLKIEDIKKNIKNCYFSNNKLLFGIYTKANNLHIGNIKAEINFEHNRGELGLLIGDKLYHNKGIGYQAINLATSYLLNKLFLKKIYAGIYENNKSSIKIFKKNNFKLEAKLIDYRLYKNKFIKGLVFSRYK